MLFLGGRLSVSFVEVAVGSVSFSLLFGHGAIVLILIISAHILRSNFIILFLSVDLLFLEFVEVFISLGDLDETLAVLGYLFL